MVAAVLLRASGSILVAAPKTAVSVRSQVIDLDARPDGFEPPLVRSSPSRKFGKFDAWKSLILNNYARGVSVANSPKSTTKHC